MTQEKLSRREMLRNAALAGVGVGVFGGAVDGAFEASETTLEL
jgi:hypothetical protein